MYKKNLIIKKKPTRAKNKISFVASTDTADRYGDVINQEGWNLDAYRNNPVVLLNHNANALPIGRGEVKIKDKQLVIDVVFDKDDETAQVVERKARNGFMNAVSVGFNPIEQMSRSELPKDHPAFVERGGGNYFNKSELLEVSIVTIPANSEATQMSAKNINIRNLIRQELKNIITKNNVKNNTVEIEAPEGHHWMNYKDGPVLMAGDDVEHEGSSKVFAFELISKHDPARLKEVDDQEEEEKKLEEEEEEQKMKEEEEEEEKYKYDDEEEENKKDFLTFEERELLKTILSCRR